MTYWPISSPSVFAATKRTDLGRSRVSSDGVERKQLGDQDAGPDNGSAAHSEKEKAAKETRGVEENGNDQLSRAAARGQQVEDDIHGTIVAVRVTRNGHLFATLTRTTLTVWQTKVSIDRVLGRHVLIDDAAYCCFGLRTPLRTIRQNIWPEYRCPSSP